MAVRTYKRSKDGATVYVAVFRGPNGEQKTRKVRTVPVDAPKREHDRARVTAEKHAQDERAKVENGTWTDTKVEGLTFGKLVKRFLREYRPRSGRPRYYRERSSVWLAHIPAARPVAAITVRDVERMVRARRAKAQDATVRKDVQSISTLFRWAVRHGYMVANPAAAELVRRPPDSRPDPNPLSEDEERALLDALEESYPWAVPVVEFALETGADRGEMISMNWRRHVDRHRRLVKLPRAKTGTSRVIPYEQNTRIKRVLADAARVEHPSGRVFLNSGRPVHLEAIKTAMRRAWKKAGIQKRRPWKSLRATFATRKLEDGVPVPTVAALMGLTSAHVLEHYAKPSGQHLLDAMCDRVRDRESERSAEPATPPGEIHVA